MHSLAPTRPRRRANFRRPATLAAAFCFTLAAAASVRAYDDDTHYWLTYYLAREAGYTRLQAAQVASAAFSVDYESRTNPVLPTRTFHPQGVRARLHALVSKKGEKNCRRDARKMKLPAAEEQAEVEKCVEKLVLDAEQPLWERALASGNPGVYLHYFEDKYAHRGFESRIGHAAAGHAPDFLSTDPRKAEEMALATVARLRLFLEEYWKDHWKNNAPPPPPDEARIKRVVKRFVEADGVNSLFASLVKRPNSFLGAEIVEGELAGERLPPIWLYRLDGDGEPRRDAGTHRACYLSRTSGLRKMIQRTERLAWRLLPFDTPDPNPEATTRAAVMCREKAGVL